MRVIKVVYVVWLVLISNCIGVAIQPSTFGGVVDSFGRITNTIKVNILHGETLTLLFDQLAQNLHENHIKSVMETAFIMKHFLSLIVMF